MTKPLLKIEDLPPEHLKAVAAWILGIATHGGYPMRTDEALPQIANLILKMSQGDRAATEESLK